MNSQRTPRHDSGQEPLVLTNWQLRLHLPARPGLPRPTPAARGRGCGWRANSIRLSVWTLFASAVIGHLLTRRP